MKLTSGTAYLVDLGSLTWHGSRIDTMRPNDGSPAIGLGGVFAAGALEKVLYNVAESLLRAADSRHCPC
jgi:hypothetical protein